MFTGGLIEGGEIKDCFYVGNSELSCIGKDEHEGSSGCKKSDNIDKSREELKDFFGLNGENKPVLRWELEWL